MSSQKVYDKVDYFSPARFFDPTVALAKKVDQAKAELDKHVVDIVRWHFSAETGTPFWLEMAKT